MSAVDLVVIGAGVVGAAIARAASRAGLSVVLCDKGDLGGAVSGASLACVGTHMIDRDEVPLLIHSAARWAELEAETGCAIEYHRCGQLRFVLDPADLPVARAWIDHERGFGLERALLEPAEVRAIEPRLEGPILAATWSPESAVVNPFLAVRALARDAARHGATILPRTPVEAIEVTGERVTGVRTPAGLFAAGAVVLAAGPWTTDLARPLGVDLPIAARKAQCLATTRLPPGTIRTVVGACEAAAGVQAGYTQIQQAASGQVLFNTVLAGAAMRPGTPDRPAPVDPAFVDDSVAMLRHLFPSLANAALLRSWVGYESVCPDDRFAIGRIGPDGLVVAAGCSGTGFTRAPAIGEIVTGLLTGEASPLDRSLYDPARLAA